MTIKVKHTKNGNVKITMTLEQAEYLRNVLLETAYLARPPKPEGMALETTRDIESAMDSAGIEWKR